MENREGYCNNKLTVVKITDNQQSSSVELSINSPLTTAVNYHTYTYLQADASYIESGISKGSRIYHVTI